MTDGLVTGTARPFHIGARSQVWSIEIRDPRERLVCISRLTMAVVEWRPHERSASVNWATPMSMYALHALAGFIGVTSGATVDRRVRVRAAVDRRGAHELCAARRRARHLARVAFPLAGRAHSGRRWSSDWRCSCIALVLSALGLDQPRFFAAHRRRRRGRRGRGLRRRARGCRSRWARYSPGIWILYRVVRGWLALRDGKAMNG